MWLSNFARLKTCKSLKNRTQKCAWLLKFSVLCCDGELKEFYFKSLKFWILCKIVFKMTCLTYIQTDITSILWLLNSANPKTCKLSKTRTEKLCMIIKVAHTILWWGTFISNRNSSGYYKKLSSKWDVIYWVWNEN